MKTKVVRLFGVAFLTSLLSLQTMNAAAEGSDTTDRFSELVDCFTYHWGGCNHANDAKNWAIRVTDWKFPGYGKHNDMADAFRHCAWMGATATRLGKTAAFGIGLNHEEHAPGPKQERDMDESNNLAGAQIGEEAKEIGVSDQWGYVLSHCESKARNHKLFGLGGVMGNY